MGRIVSIEPVCLFEDKVRCIWTALLATVPFVSHTIYDPVIPCQAPVNSLAVALLVIGLWRCFVPFCRRTWLRNELVSWGFASISLLVPLEATAILLGRGDSFVMIGSGQNGHLFRMVSINLEFTLAALTFFAWYLAYEKEGRCSNDNKFGVTSYLFGSLWPLLPFSLCSLIGGPVETANPAPWIISSLAAVALVALARKHIIQTANDALLLLCGQLIYLVFKSFALSDSSYNFGGMQPLWQWWVVFAFFVAISLLWLWVCRHINRYISAGIERPSANTLDLALQHVRELHGIPAREFEVLVGIMQGMTSRQIAEKMDITTSGVSAHRSRLYERLGLSGAIEVKNYVHQIQSHINSDHHADRLETGVINSTTSVLRFLVILVLFVVAFTIDPYSPLEAFGVSLSMSFKYVTWFGAAVLCLLGVLHSIINSHKDLHAFGTDSLLFCLRVLLVISMAISFAAYVSIDDYFRLSGPLSLFLYVTIHVCEMDGYSVRIIRTPRLFFKFVTAAFESLISIETAAIASASIILATGFSLDTCIFIARLFSLPVPILSCVVYLFYQRIKQLKARQSNTDILQDDKVIALFSRKGMSLAYAQVAYGLVEGLDAKTISERYNISPNTVRTYWQRIRKKFGIDSVEELRSILAGQITP